MPQNREPNLVLLAMLTYNAITGQSTGATSNLIDSMNPGREIEPTRQPPVERRFRTSKGFVAVYRPVRQPSGKRTCGHF
jgi:hypothetical protein